MIPGIELLAVYVYNPWIFLYRSLFVAHRSFFADYSRLYRAFERLITCDIYIYIKEKKKEYNKKTEGKMEWDMYFSISVIFFYSKLFYFIRCTTISYVTCIFMIIELYIFFISPFFYLCFIRLISNQLNNLFFFLLIILDPISLLNSITPLLSLASVLQIRRSSPPLFSTF